MNALKKLIVRRDFNNICIAGFGREGKSTFSFLNQLPPRFITIVDRNNIDKEAIENPAGHQIEIQTGEHYLDNLNRFDVIIKSPGVRFPAEIEREVKNKLTSQTSLFLEAFHQQVIGITGTKGKSTTSSLIYHILKEAGRDTVLVGNIGIPAFSLAEQIGDRSLIVFELSAQQLYDVKHSPHVALFLSLFPDHIDYFGDMDTYEIAKSNIARYQDRTDILIYNPSYPFIRNIAENRTIRARKIGVTPQGSLHFDRNRSLIFPNGNNKSVLNFEQSALKGEHNLVNLLAALEATTYHGVPFETATSAVYSFKTLENRLEYVGCYGGRHFYNDSIATVPDAAVAALNAIENVQTIILGGYDRGVDFSGLITSIAESKVGHIIFTGASGKRMMELLYTLFPGHGKEVFYFEHYDGLVEKAVEVTPENSVCILSPAAPSFDSFNNFEERGNYFKEKIRSLYR